MRPLAGFAGGEGLLCALHDDLTTAIVSALRTYPVVHNGSAAIGANAQRRNRSMVVSSPLVTSLLGDFVFRMCHFVIVFKISFPLQKFPKG